MRDLPEGKTLCHCQTDEQMLDRCLLEVTTVFLELEDGLEKNCPITVLSEYWIKSKIAELVFMGIMHSEYGDSKTAIKSHELLIQKLKKLIIDSGNKVPDYVKKAVNDSVEEQHKQLNKMFAENGISIDTAPKA